MSAPGARATLTGSGWLVPPTGYSTDVGTSGATDAESLTVEVRPPSASTQQQQTFAARSLFYGPGAITVGGWLTPIKAEIGINAAANVDKAVGIASFLSVQGGSQVSGALGFEAVVAGLGGTSNIAQYAGFYVANVAAVPNINRVGAFYGFACDYADGHYKSVGRYLKATRTATGDQMQEVGPAHPGHFSGRFYHPAGIHLSSSGDSAGDPFPTAALAANFITAIPFVCYSRTTFDRIGMRIKTAQASGGVRLGIYYAQNGRPGTLLVDAGAIDASTTGQKLLNINATLEAGFYFLAALSNNGGIVANWCHIADIRNLIGTTDDGQVDTTLYVAQAYGALPATFGTASSIGNSLQVPHVFLRAA